jgi:hypothetical protein
MCNHPFFPFCRGSQILLNLSVGVRYLIALLRSVTPHEKAPRPSLVACQLESKAIAIDSLSQGFPHLTSFIDRLILQECSNSAVPIATSLVVPWSVDRHQISPTALGLSVEFRNQTIVFW